MIAVVICTQTGEDYHFYYIENTFDLVCFRPKCDAKRHFGLTMTFKSNRRSSKSCLQFKRKWWAAQIIPQGKEPIFKFNGYANSELAALDCLNNGNEKKLVIKGLRNTEYKLHDEGEICMSSTQRNFKQKFDVFIITKPLNDDPTRGIQTYQSPRFECQYKTNGPHCVVKHPEDVTCDDSF